MAACRVDFVEFVPREQYLERYHHLDLCLDTFPYNGHTTNLDGLWMGVPVVTRSGSAPVSRAGLSLLSNVGLADLVAVGSDDFVGIAVRLARDPDRLAAMRAGLRERVTGSPLMDSRRFARAVEVAYRTFWDAACRPE